MTLSGSKVETIERPDENLKNVVVGKILEMKRHENSDHMWVCQVDVGGDKPIQIVTGAQNQQVGDMVPVALDGALLPDGKEIHAGTLRGEASNGMRCSLKELGLTLHDYPYAIEDGLWVMQEDGVKPGDDIAAVIGLKNSTTGDTLCDEKHPIVLESMEFPEPVIRVAIEPKTKAGQEKMAIALAKLAEEDPTFRTYTDEETGQTIIAGMGELHLEIIVDRLLREFKVEANVGAPQVAYKETVRKNADVDMKYARQSGGKGQYGHVKIRLSPNESGKGYEFINSIVGGAIPKEYIPAVDAGIQGAMLSGVLAGYPVVDVKVTLYDGSYHEVDSSEMAFKIAGSMAFKEACQKAGPTLLEPIMKVCVIVPDEYMGDVIGDLNSRRGQIQGFEARSGAQQIDAFVPLAEMFGYATDLRSCTQGRGQYTMEPAHYIEIPKSIQEKIISQRTNRA